jgi:hypothetical protein
MGAGSGTGKDQFRRSSSLRSLAGRLHRYRACHTSSASNYTVFVAVRMVLWRVEVSGYAGWGKSDATTLARN